MMLGRLRHPVLTAGLAVAALLGGAGCAETPPRDEAPPITVRLVDIQSGTVRVHLHQVVQLDTSHVAGNDGRYTAEIADEHVVSVIQRRDETDGRFEPELVPRRVGVTQVALISSIPGAAVVGFKVLVGP